MDQPPFPVVAFVNSPSVLLAVLSWQRECPTPGHRSTDIHFLIDMVQAAEMAHSALCVCKHNKMYRNPAEQNHVIYGSWGRVQPAFLHSNEHTKLILLFNSSACALPVSTTK